MRRSEQGFTIVELVVAIAIMSLIGLGAAMTIFQVINVTGRSNNHLTAVRQVQNAGYWTSRDAQMAEIITTDNLSPAELVILAWTERDYDSDDIYHSATYFLEELSDGVGKLKRNHWSSAGANYETLVAEYIYYDPGDPVNTSQASYQDSMLTLQLTALYEATMETREYRISCRANL